ncbi:hypothetical protein CGCSCA4_v011092 [Colletotrichum siamense]|uniref:Uncharacterized protein n=1 Tax=Colletotrichum siamense TaxID=690259 RepID=A0A9P5K114_COLSI|nr:hypothetical protein CGCSCA4_v011092 [Colletotrichum siamense]KAF4853966.1 hypothetical protein CGCSCA2_v009673 [Colletotrichum siamense]
MNFSESHIPQQSSGLLSLIVFNQASNQNQYNKTTQTPSDTQRNPFNHLKSHFKMSHHSNDSQLTLVNNDGNQEAPSQSKAPKKKSLYQRLTGSRAGEISEEDMLKYTGKSKEELKEWAKDRPDVGKNQAAGRVDRGNNNFGVIGLGVH